MRKNPTSLVRLLPLICLMFVLQTVSAQKVKVTFGKLDKDLLTINTYPKDPEAHAVILYDKGYFNGTEFKFTRHLRLKVLTSAGANFANFTVQTPSKSFIKGITYNLENDSVVTTKLEKSNIFEEEIIHRFKAYKVFFPNVKPGSVIELEYSHESMPFEWEFQDRIPVVYNELVVEENRNIAFTKNLYGFETVKQEGNNRWIARDIPALKEEPYMNHYSNYLTRFEFDIESINLPQWHFYKEFSTSWESVGKALMDNDYFGGIFKSGSRTGSPFLNEKAEQLQASSASTEEKIREAFRYIQENIKWNKQESAFASSEFRNNFLKNHSGNSGEINLLLLSLLNKAGIKALPMVMSTRDNGVLNQASPAFSKLNHVAVYVKHENITMILDASSPYTVPGIIPERCMNFFGWVIDQPTGFFVDLTQSKASLVKQYIRIFSESGNMVAEITNTYEDYAFMEWIEKYEEFGNDTEYSNYLRSIDKSVELTGYNVKSVDKNKLRATEKITVSLGGSDYLQDIGQALILNPFVMNSIDNPFKSDTRKFPIDFVYPRGRSISVSIVLPEGHEVAKLPESVTLDSGIGAKFSFVTNTMNNIVNMRCDFLIVTPYYVESDYQKLKNFFSEFVSKLSEPVEIRKKT
ncbi:MAG TPA: DUF3857 domain-containing protein [Chryseosolibacter sp.]|nr:DUF3857 domain-containing protein [Chryseosolibacter sp.]